MTVKVLGLALPLLSPHSGALTGAWRIPHALQGTELASVSPLAEAFSVAVGNAGPVCQSGGAIAPSGSVPSRLGIHSSKFIDTGSNVK